MSAKKLKNSVWFALYGTSPTANCFWCSVELTFKEATLDHEPPKCLVGKKTAGLISCYGCNRIRGEILNKVIGTWKKQSKAINAPPDIRLNWHRRMSVKFTIWLGSLEIAHESHLRRQDHQSNHRQSHCAQSRRDNQDAWSA